MRVLTLAIVLCVAISASLAAQSGDVSSLRRAMEGFCAAANRADMDYIDKHYLPEVSRFHSSGELDLGWTEEKALGFRQAFDDGFSFSFERCEIVDARAYGEVGITAGHMYGHMTLVDGTLLQGPWRFTYLWVRRDGEWREAHHHVSLLGAE